MHLKQGQDIFDLHAVLVRGLDVFSGDAGLKQNLSLPDTAYGDIGIANVDGKKHNDSPKSIYLFFPRQPKGFPWNP